MEHGSPKRVIISSYLNPGFCTAIDSCYAYDERLLVNEIERLFEFHFGDNAAVNVSQSTETRADHESSRITESIAEAWNNRASASSYRSFRRNTGRRNSLRKEFTLYQTDVDGRKFTAADSRNYWSESIVLKKFLDLLG